MRADSPTRVRASAKLRRRFATRYRGRHDPDDALDWLIDPHSSSRRGTPPPPRAPDQTILYQRNPTGDAPFPTLADQIADAQRMAEQDRIDAAHAVTEVLAARRMRRRRASVVALLIVVTLGLSAAFVTARLTVADRTLRAQAATAVIDSDGQAAPEQLFAHFPDRLDKEWAHRPPTSATELDGAKPVTVQLQTGTTRILLVVACTAADRSYEYGIAPVRGSSPALRGYGACGRLRGIELAAPTGATSLRLLVTTRGIDPFALTVYAR